jgi:hypothetical protein
VPCAGGAYLPAITSSCCLLYSRTRLFLAILWYQHSQNTHSTHMYIALPPTATAVVVTACARAAARAACTAALMVGERDDAAVLGDVVTQSGDAVGPWEGLAEGVAVGRTVGLADGPLVGERVDAVGTSVGVVVGAVVGLRVGLFATAHV